MGGYLGSEGSTSSKPIRELIVADFSHILYLSMGGLDHER